MAVKSLHSLALKGRIKMMNHQRQKLPHVNHTWMNVDSLSLAYGYSNKRVFAGGLIRSAPKTSIILHFFFEIIDFPLELFEDI
jgi:hypothetical protein